MTPSVIICTLKERSLAIREGEERTGSVPNEGVSAIFVSVEAAKQRLRRGTSLTGRCRMRRNIGGANRR